VFNESTFVLTPD